MNQSRKPLRLTALRLVGFHNFHDQLIPIRGDLFAVGSNESGKTTILDALHMVLTGDHQVDLNAAASMVATREPARKVQGIILRADMAGRPRKKGGITYVAAELSQQDSAHPPYTLLLGMYAADMNSRVNRWGLICRRPAAELPLTQPADDGQVRIVDGKELEQALDQRAWRRMGEYRDAVAQLLLDDPSEFGSILDLWRKAKSYRELARTSRDPAAIIRQVLPSPDQQAFENVAKSLADVAEWEMQLDELRRDVEALGQLEDKLRNARDARETCRRYVYVEAWHNCDQLNSEFESLQNRLKNQHQSHDSLTRQLEACQHEITDADKSLNELRASQGMRLIEQIQNLESRLTDAARRLQQSSDISERLRQRIEQHEQNKVRIRQTFMTTLAKTASALNKIDAILREQLPELAHTARQVHNTLPESLDASCNAEAMRQSVKKFLNHAGECIKRLHQKDRECETAMRELQTQHQESQKTLNRLKQYEDLVPDLVGLDRALEKLQQHDIPYQMLYQTIEFAKGVNEHEAAAVETALGIERLATIVVAPPMVSKARKIVDGLNAGLRVLEAQLAPTITSRMSVLADRLLDRLVIVDVRVKAHLLAIANEMAFLNHSPEEGSPLTWWTADGRSGEPGVRKAGEYLPLKWIGSQHRRQQRQARIAALQSELEKLNSQIADIQAQRKQLDHLQQHVEQARHTLTDLNLPWVIQNIYNDLLSTDSQLKELHSDTQRARDEKENEQREHDRLSDQLTQAKQQAIKADAQALLAQVTQLNHQIQELGNRKEELIGKVATSQANVQNLEKQLENAKKTVEPAERRLVETTDALLVVLDGVEADNLHHHVFTEKRASQIKWHNLRKLIEDAVGKESATFEVLKGSDGVMSTLLAQRYGFHIEDKGGRLEILDPKDQVLVALVEHRRTQWTDAEQAMGPRTQQLFQRVLGTELIGQLRDNLTELRRRQRELNSVLESLVFGHSRFKLHETLVDEYKSFVALIESASLTSDAARDDLIDYIRERKDAFDTQGNVPGFLDYRNWFDFSLRLRHVSNETAGVVGSEDMVRGSGGAQGTHIYLLLFAMATLLYNRCGARLRLLMLDEAFYGVDPQRKELLLRCGKQLKLDFAIATPDLDGTITEDGGDSTTVLVEKDADDEVDVVPFVWEHHKPQQELFADPRPDATIPGTQGELT